MHPTLAMLYSNLPHEAEIKLGGRSVEIISTRQVGASDRLDYWNEVIGSTYRGMVVDAKHPTFEAQISVWQLAQLRMVRPHSSSAVVQRHQSRSTIGSSHTILAHIVNAGQIDLDQRGRRISLGVGDMVLCAGEERYRFDCATQHQLTVIEFDGQTLSSRIPNLEDRIAVRIPGQTPGSRIFRSFLSSLWLEAGSPLDLEMANTQASVLIDLLGACLADTAPSNAVCADAILQRVRDVIAEQLGNFDLGPALVAREARVPLRTLQAAAARQGTTIGQMITDFRLNRGADLLRTNPRKSVIEVSLECGFSDSSYFARRFSQRFGMSPRSYRLAH